jgi:hypothetical protein
VAQVVQEKVESYRSLVPLIEMEWSSHLDNWSAK